MLGLWEAAEQGGATIRPETWDRAAKWLISTQGYDGSWKYRSETNDPPPNISMTAAGTGSLLICKSQLAPYFKAEEPINPLLIPIETETSRKRYYAQTPVASIDNAVGKGTGWLISNYQINAQKIMGQTPYYGLYGIERVCALAHLDVLGGHPWFAEGKAFIEGGQDSMGAWNSMYGPDVNTCWAVLFLIRANASTVKIGDIKRLGAGTLRGGRNLPKNLADLTIVNGQVVVRPMDGAVSDMLKVLEDPKAQNADAALAGLMAEYDKRGPEAAPAPEGPPPQAADRPRPRRPPDRRLVPGADRRTRRRPGPHQHPARRPGQAGHDRGPQRPLAPGPQGRRLRPDH